MGVGEAMRFSSLVLAIQRRAVLFSVVALVVVAGGTAAVLLTHGASPYVATTRIQFPATALPPPAHGDALSEIPYAEIPPAARVEQLSGSEVLARTAALLKAGDSAEREEERPQKRAAYQGLAADALRGALDVQWDPVPQIATVRVQAPTEEMARDVANVLPRALQAHLAQPYVSEVRRRRTAAEERAAQGANNLKVARQRLQRHGEGRRYPSDPRALNEMLYQETGTLARRKERRQDVERDLDLLRDRMTRVEREPSILRGEIPPSATVIEMESQLAQVEARYAALPPDGEEARGLLAPLADLRARLASERVHYEAAQIVQIRARERGRMAALEKEAALLAEQCAEGEERIRDLAQHKEALLACQADVVAYEQQERDAARDVRRLQEGESREPRYVVVAERAAGAARPRPSVPTSAIPVSIVGGLMLGAAAALLAERFNDRLRTPTDVRRYVHLPLLGTLPVVRGGTCTVLKLAPRDMLIELWNRIVTVVGALADRHNARAVMVTSVVEGEGKSSCAVNLAATFARLGRRVVLVDGDLRRPTLHGHFGIENRIGLSSFLTGKLAARMLLEDIKRRIVAEETGVPETAPTGLLTFQEPLPAAGPAEAAAATDLQPGDLRALNGAEAAEAPAAVAVAAPPAAVPGLEQILIKTPVENLWLVPSGPVPTDPGSLVRHPMFKSLVERLKADADLVIIDSPPLASVSDGLALSASADACVLVVGADEVTRQQVRWAKTLLDDVGARHLGVLLNRAVLPDKGYTYYADGRKKYCEGP